MKFWALLIMGAVSPFLFASTLPSWVALLLLLLTALGSLNLPARSRVFCLFPVFFLITTLEINHRIAQRLPLSESKSSYEITGVIGSLPETQSDGVVFY